MALPSQADASDLLLPWVDPAFLNAFGLHHPLLYFSQCPAFDRASNTAECLNQGLEPRAMAAQLRTMIGIQYEMIETRSAPQLHCIGMFYRSGPDAKQLLKAYYILDGTIFRAPSLGEVLMQRIASCARELGKLSEDLLEATTVFPGGYPVLDFVKAMGRSSAGAGDEAGEHDHEEEEGEEEEEEEEDNREREGLAKRVASHRIAGPELDSIILNLWTQQ